MRNQIYLNGEWNFMPDYQNQTPDKAVKNCRWETQPVRVPSSWRWMIHPEADYQPYDLFGYPRPWNNAQSGVLYRTFTAEKKENERLFLIFEGVLQKSAIFVNGVKLLETEEGFLPLEIDITAHINPGQENDLKVWCGPFSSIDTPVGKKDLAPNGSWFGKLARGIWQDVYLEYRPALFIEDVFVQTSTRKQEIKVDVTGQNLAETQTGRIKLTIFDGDTAVKTLESDEFQAGAGEPFSLSLANFWADAIYWSPENPHLYTLKTEFISNEKSIDQVETRIGFREFWIDGHKLYLNGTRLNLRIDAWHYQGFVQQTKAYALNWYQACKETGINCVRPHAMPYPKFYYDAADETGMLIIDESALYGSSKSNPADHPQFIANCAAHLRALVRRDRNHPSIIMWSMQNEMRWVDGRDGYKAAMPDLTQAMKSLDPTRPVSYDGDNRLVDPETLEIVSMHYNIDGTVQSWQKDKPLIFGEHGKWHYVCPQACCELGGHEALYSYAGSQAATGLHERYFIEYARKEEVAGLCPFNMSNYMVRPMPPQDIPLTWDDLSTPGVKPDVIKSHSMTINNGQYDGPIFRPDESWQPVRQAFKPVTIIPNQYNAAFFGGTTLTRSFSIYNDTEQPAAAKLLCRLSAADGQIIASAGASFTHAPGQREERQFNFALPDVETRQQLTLQIELYHGDNLAHTLTQNYSIAPASLKETPIHTHGKQIGFAGNARSRAILSRLIPNLISIEEPNSTSKNSSLIPHPSSFASLDMLIIGQNFAGDLNAWQPVLDEFVSRGGFLLILEQNRFVPGEVALSGKKFYGAFINDREHPVFDDLSNEDLRFWGPENFHQSDRSFLVQNAFHKPVQGDLNILLECGTGDFGYGGLLWTPMVEYAVGAGRVILNQVELIANFDTVPHAAQLLRNLLAYGVKTIPQSAQKTALLTSAGSQVQAFFDSLGLAYDLISEVSAKYPIILLDPDNLKGHTAQRLKEYIETGGKLVILPVRPEHQPLLAALLGEDAGIRPAPLYQLKPTAHSLTRGISAHDLFHIERASYAQITQKNLIICKHALEIAGGERLWESVQNPWEAYFIEHTDNEYRKAAIATMNVEAEFKPQSYGQVKTIGRGSLLFTQVRLVPGNEKIRRVYARLLGNLGAGINTHLLSYRKDEKDYSIESLMALPHLPHQDYVRMEAYFTDPGFILNNLGEGAFGWMKPLEKEKGWITVPDSAGETWFLTVFVESEVNRNPAQRTADALPDPSIVPDMEVSANCAFKLFINGRCHFEHKNGSVAGTNLYLEDTLLSRGINRLVFVCRAGKKDIKINARFKNKFGDYLTDLKYRLTID